MRKSTQHGLLALLSFASAWMYCYAIAFKMVDVWFGVFAFILFLFITVAFMLLRNDARNVEQEQKRFNKKRK